jgi:hypothetical protein
VWFWSTKRKRLASAMSQVGHGAVLACAFRLIVTAPL